MVFKFLDVFKLLVASIFFATAAYSNDVSGAYLAARQAVASHNYRIASDYFVRALTQSPHDKNLISQAMSAFLAAGDFDTAFALAEKLDDTAPNSTLVKALNLARAFKLENYHDVIEQLDQKGVAGPSIDRLLKGWAFMGLGQVENAMEEFHAVSSSQGMQSFSSHQKALALGLVGDFESAENILVEDKSTQVVLSSRGQLAYAQILMQLERYDDAIKFLTKIYEDRGDQEIGVLISRIRAGAPIDFNIVRNGSEGAGEVFLFLASALRDGESQNGLIFYTRLASYLAPENMHATLLSAKLLEELGSYDLAVAAYDMVPRNHPSFVKAELGRANALSYIGKTETAIEVLTQLSESFPSVRGVYDALGNLLRRDGQYEKATKVYDIAIDMIRDPQPKHWYNFYVRAIAHERQGKWDYAERDFRKALVLSPKQFQVLNYMGYSLVERGERLDEALSMIKIAVNAQPEAGYIIDSLGWVQYKLGFFDEAVIQLERAAELMATDPIVNDHLGDSYWAVGRKVEARFQWRRALSFITNDTAVEDIDPIRVQKKLDVGLDAVLAAEGKPPLRVADSD